MGVPQQIGKPLKIVSLSVGLYFLLSESHCGCTHFLFVHEDEFFFIKAARQIEQFLFVFDNQRQKVKGLRNALALFDECAERIAKQNFL